MSSRIIVFLPDTEDCNDFINVISSHNITYFLVGKKKWRDGTQVSGSIARFWLSDEDFNADSLLQILERICDTYSLAKTDIFLLGLRERSVELIGDVVDKSGCQGITAQTAKLFRDKWEMVQHARNINIPIPETWLPSSMLYINKFPRDGIIIKPRRGSSAEGVRRLSTMEETQYYITSNVDSGSYIFQSYVKGDVYHVDGVVFDGETVAFCVGKYLNPLLYVGREPRCFWMSWINSEESEFNTRLREYHDRIVSAFNLNTGCTHMEFFRSPDGKIVFCEAAARPPGTRIIAMHRFLWGSTTPEIFAFFLCGARQKFERRNEPAFVGMIAFTPEGPVRRADSLSKFTYPWIIHTQEWPASAVEGGRYSSALGRVFIHANDQDTCEERLRLLENDFAYELT